MEGELPTSLAESMVVVDQEDADVHNDAHML